MATEIKTWQIADGRLRPLDSSMIDAGRTEASDLEQWIASNPSIIGAGLAIIGRQVTTRSGPLDLLAIDKDGNLVIVELKRDSLPREALAQAIDYASDVADWSIEKIGEVCAKYAQADLKDVLGKCFPEIDIDSININENQRVVLVGFSIEASLERMVSWLSDRFGVGINAVVLKYAKTARGDELLIATSIIPEEIEQERIRKRKFQIPMSDEPGEHAPEELEKLLSKYLASSLWSARRIRKVLLPACLERGALSRDELKAELVRRGEADNNQDAGRFLSLVSRDIGMEKNAFLRQVIGYSYPNYEWEKDNYHIRSGYPELVKSVLEKLGRTE